MIHKIDNAICQGSSMIEAKGSHVSDIYNLTASPKGRPEHVLINYDYDSLVIMMNELNKLVSEKF
ncbi:MAG: hypothetical protein ACI9P5_003782 [Saprospiraceae bacterium]|jgi:hypothetical protein